MSDRDRLTQLIHHEQNTEYHVHDWALPCQGCSDAADAILADGWVRYADAEERVANYLHQVINAEGGKACGGCKEDAASAMAFGKDTP